MMSILLDLYKRFPEINRKEELQSDLFYFCYKPMLNEKTGCINRSRNQC